MIAAETRSFHKYHENNSNVKTEEVALAKEGSTPLPNDGQNRKRNLSLSLIQSGNFQLVFVVN